MNKRLVSGALIAGMLSVNCMAEEQAGVQTMSVWARVLFGVDGKPIEYVLADEARYPPKFVEGAKARLARATIEPAVADGQPATMRTGVELRFEVVPTSQGMTVKATGLSVSPLPLLEDAKAGPETLRVDGWKGELTAICQVGIEGKCVAVDVVAPHGTPEKVRRYAKTSLDRWRFEPQQIGDKAVQGEYKHTIVIMDNTDYKTPEDFRRKAQ